MLVWLFGLATPFMISFAKISLSCVFKHDLRIIENLAQLQMSKKDFLMKLKSLFSFSGVFIPTLNL